MKGKAFTLIELIAVLVILAILALIVTPLVMNIIRKSRIAADKRSIDAYGRSIELAIANYLLDNGDFPEDISELTIEYKGDEVVCSTTQLNSDSSVYLAGCTVAGRSVDYTYGKESNITYDAYEIGDEVTYNNVDYYVIVNSDSSEESVTLLKAEPLTVSEVNQYGGVGTTNNHVNMHVHTVSSHNKTAGDQNGYGVMQYYSSSTCGYNDNWVYSGCNSDYAQSEVKYVVDAWASDKAPAALEARLITHDELTDNLGYENKNEGTTAPSSNGTTPDWVYSSKYIYYTMSQYGDSISHVWSVNPGGELNCYGVSGDSGVVVRPVITISKSALTS